MATRYFTTPRFTMMLALASALGCDPAEPDDAADTSDGGSEDTGEPAPVYVLVNEVYTADGSNSYLNLIPSLDITELDYGKAVEHAGGRATAAAHEGFLYVVGPEDPRITKYEVSDDGALEVVGELGFSNYGFPANSLTLDEWSNTFVAPDKAYLLNPNDGTTIVWNPEEMVIVGEVAMGSHQLLRDPPLFLNYTPGVVQGDRMLRAVNWADWDAYEFSEEGQYLAVYDLTTDTLVDLIPEDRCPSLSNRVERDEAGNLYFSNWIWNVAETLTAGAPSSCALRVSAGTAAFDPDWKLDYKALTEGREAAMFAHLGGDRALLSVFHDERATIDDQTSPAELASTDNWRVWAMDLAAGAGAPLDGLDWMAGAASTFHLDDRNFLLVPTADWGRTDLYEIIDGRAEHRLEINGWSFQLFRLR